jgi:pyruvate dehydrogenase E2 component (dihydrolipoamide acetyltransferase)
MAVFPITIESAGGEYMESVLVVAWAAKPGDRVKKGDLLVTVETAKAATEVGAEHDGWLLDIKYVEGTEAPVGAVLGSLADSESEVSALPAATPVTTAGAHPASTAAPAAPTKALDRVVASPLARRIAQAAELDLRAISGTGPRGRIKRRDVDAFLSRMRESKAPDRINAVQPGSTSGARTLPAETIVLIHGFGADKTSWRQVLPLLPASYETIALDLPGHGSEAGNSAQDISEIALSLSDRLEALGVTQAHLVGHSLGGAAVLQLAAIGRIAVRSVTLLAPGGLGPDIHAGFVAGLTQSPTPEALGNWLDFMVADRSSLPAGFAGAAFRQMQRIGNAQVLAGMASRLFPSGTQSFNLGRALAGLTVPTRIVWGRQDRVIPCEHANVAPAFAALHILSDVGHTPQLETPQLTARLILETVRSAG